MVRITMRVSVGLVMAASLMSLALNDLVDVGDPSRMPPQMSFVQYALGQVTRDEFVTSVGKGVLEPIIRMKREPPRAKVLYVGEARAYYAKQSVVYSTAFDQNPLTAISRVAKTPEELLAALRAQGITHVYVNYSELNRLQRGYDYMTDADWSLIEETLHQGQFARAVHEFGRRIVYELER